MSARGPRLALPALLAVIAAASLAAADGNEAHAETVVQVPLDSGIVPGGLAVGDEFRLLFTPGVGHSFTDAKIQNMAAGSAKPIIQEFSPHFRVLHFGHSDRDDIRSHTYTEGTGVPVYWLGGSKIADNYDDFYAGGTPGRSADSRNEHGQILQSARYSYGISPIFRVAAEGSEPVLIPFVTLKPKTPLVGTENASNPKLEILLSSPLSKPLTINVNVTESVDLIHSARKYFLTQTNVTINANAVALEQTLSIHWDDTHEPDGTITYRLLPGEGYIVGSPSSVTFTILDDDPDPNLPPPPQECTHAKPCVSLDASGHYFEGRKVTVRVDADPPVVGVKFPGSQGGGIDPLNVYFETRDSGYILDKPDNHRYTAPVVGRSHYYQLDTTRDCNPSGDNWIEFRLVHDEGYSIKEGQEGWKNMTLTELRPHPDGPVVYIDRPAPGGLEIDEGQSIPIGGLFRSEYLACSQYVVNYSVAQTNQYLPGGQTGSKTTVIQQGQISNQAGTISLKSAAAGNQGGGTVTVTLLPGTGYRVGSASTVTFEIEDTSSGAIVGFSPPPPPAVSIGLAGGGSEGDPVDFGIDVTPTPLQAPLPVNVTLSGTGNILNASDAGWRIITIPTSGLYTLQVDTLNDTVADANTVTLTINPGDGYALGTFSTWTVDVQDNGNLTAQELQAPPPLESSRAERQTAVAVDPVLVANVTAMASQTHHGHDHVDRWTRVLAAFGEADHSNPMTAAEARANAGTYSSPLWPLVADTLELLEAEADAQQQTPPPQQQQQQQQTPPQQQQQQQQQAPIDPALVAGVKELASQTHHGHDHVDRWTRVLAAFGEADHSNPMTAAEARENSERYSSPLWPQIADVLAARE